jgi:hypothetical protein
MTLTARGRLRLFRIVVCVVVASMSAPAAAQRPPRDMVRRFTVEQWDRFRPLFKLVEQAAAGQPVPSDLTLAWQCHVLKAESNVDLTLFTLKVVNGEFTSFPLAMYLRVVKHGAPAPAPGPRDALAQYPFEDVALFDKPSDGRISRAFVAPAGQWDVYVALRGAATLDTPVPPTVVFKQEVDLPDLSTDLAVSSPIVADKIEADLENKRLDFEDQLDQPYRLWGARITPALEERFGHGMKLSVVFLVYNTGVAANDKPDVVIDYNFFQKMGTSDRFLGRTSSQSLNPGTLRPDFSLAAGDLLVAGQDMPLDRFPDGDFRLEIKVTDNTSGKSLTRNVNFTVAGH